MDATTLNLRLTQDEYTALIRAATSENVLQADYSKYGVSLRDDHSNQWAINLLDRMRNPFQYAAQDQAEIKRLRSALSASNAKATP